ncbi:Type IV secretion system protein virB4 [Candidatus Methylobacter favarea]|uniref:Type IV secretion system protein virB4 n=1 Tax=Candidatus Methylobacter favarea TaxID=2707345 RepID=A0A8S0XSH6_9GAMM|nr:VirB4 family type IV secretion system protein [Candidatus Methylobacter favarea]CAA9890772.1 Type IV secretion system protein virB4 [Candidatus Methylobacter favarea]
MGAAYKYAEAVKTEETTAAFIPYTAHITKSAVKLDSGDYIQVIKMQGAAHESADVRDINAWHDQLNGFMRNIASANVAIWSHVVRREYGEYPEGDFNVGFCRDFNEKYRRQMANEKMLVNELYLTIVYRPQPIKVAKLLNVFDKNTPKELSQRQTDELEALNDVTGAALAALDRYEPELLGCYEHNGHMFSEVLEFLAFLVDGEWRRFPLPRADIKKILATTRPMFGKGGLMALKAPTHTQYAGVVAIQEYPSITCPGIMNDLLSMPFEFVLSQSFTFLSKAVAIGRMQRQQARMVNAGDVATSQIDDIDDALDDLTSNRFVMGAHSLCLVIRANDQKSLNEHINEAGAALSDSGMKWAREDVGMAAAYWSQLPGNFAYRINVGDITSRNFAGFCSLHNYPIGRIRGNQWGDAVTMFKTTSGAPFYFNFHKGEEGADAKKAAKLDPNHKDLANTVVIGKSGTGKTVLETMLLAQAQKFHQPEHGKVLSSVLFDKDLGAAVAVRAMGGRYYPLKNGVPSGFNPFQMEPTPNHLTFLESLVKQLVKHESLPITPRQEHEISAAIKGVMAAAKPNRRLSSVLEFLDPTDENGLHVRLSRWCRGGPLGWLFDNAEDTLRLDNCTMVGFDVTEFLDNDETRTPTIMYLFHRIESLIDGRRIPIFMDEFWKLLDDPAFEDLAKNKLVTIRKQDGFLVMFTQSPQQVLKSPIAFAIISQTATKIFLPNPEADYDDYVNGFKLTKREYEIVRGLGEKSRRFLIKQGQNSVVAELNLRGFDDELAVLSGNTATSLLAERLVQEMGEDPAIWLPEFHRIRKGLQS